MYTHKQYSVYIQYKMGGGGLWGSGPPSPSPESVATLPLFGPIEGQKWFDRISSQWESQKNRFALIYFGKIWFLPPCIWNIPFMSTASGQFFWWWHFALPSVSLVFLWCRKRGGGTWVRGGGDEWRMENKEGRQSHKVKQDTPKIVINCSCPKSCSSKMSLQMVLCIDM